MGYQEGVGGYQGDPVAYNKVVFFGTTLIDLTSDTVTSATLEEGVTAHCRDGSRIVGTLKKKYVLTNKSVAASEFKSDSTYTDYPYRAAVALSGVTAAYTPYVIFSETDAETGIFSRDANSYAGGVYIYASEVPAAAVTIDKIICMEE